jgi:two-component sensor histidine kinase
VRLEGLARLQNLRVTGAGAYVLAAGLSILAIGVRLPFLGAGFFTASYLTSFPAIMLATFFGGIAGGVTATALTAIGTWYFLLPPFMSFGLPTFSGFVSLVGFLSVSAFNILAIHWLRFSLDRNRALADERELLLRELQHRVKNNFQTIQSFLYLQMRRSDNDEVKAVLTEANARLAVFVQAHDNIYGLSGRIDFRDHMKRLCARLEKGSRHRVLYEGDSADWPVEQVVRLTMIVNEMIMNGIRHGNGGTGTPIIVRLRRALPDRATELAVSARGRFPAGFTLTAGKGLGMRIIAGLAGQLHAELAVEEGPEQDFLLLRLPEDGETSA